MSIEPKTLSEDGGAPATCSFGTLDGLRCGNLLPCPEHSAPTCGDSVTSRILPGEEMTCVLPSHSTGSHSDRDGGTWTDATHFDAAPSVVSVGETYRHRKGGLYKVEGIALESTNGRPRERVVVYRSQTGGLNVRTEREFTETADGTPRFECVFPPADDGYGPAERIAQELAATLKIKGDDMDSMEHIHDALVELRDLTVAPIPSAEKERDTLRLVVAESVLALSAAEYHLSGVAPDDSPKRAMTVEMVRKAYAMGRAALAPPSEKQETNKPLEMPGNCRLCGKPLPCPDHDRSQPKGAFNGTD